MKTNKLTPTEIYLLSLQSDKSRISVTSTLSVIAKKLFNKESHKNIEWKIVDYKTVLELISLLREENKSPTTINNYLAAFKGSSKEAWKSGEISNDTYHKIKDVKRVRGTRSTKGIALTSDEIKTLVNYCDDDNLSKTTLRDSALLSITYAAGLRREEVANLSLTDINLKEGFVKILGKGNKEVVNFLNKDTIKKLEEWVAARGYEKGALFPRIRKGDKVTNLHISGQAVSDIVCKRYKACGLKRITPHDLRRSFATNLLQSGVDLFIVSDLMRHSSIETTRTYDLRNKSSRIEAARNFC